MFVYIYISVKNGGAQVSLNHIYSILRRVKRGKTERGVKRNTCIQPTITKQGINRTTLYHRTLRYDLQRIHGYKMFGLTAHHHRNIAQ